MLYTSPRNLINRPIEPILKWLFVELLWNCLEEATSARDRICSAPCERLERSAVCVVDAKLRRRKKASELVVVPGNQLGVFVPGTLENRGIQAGDAVFVLPYAGPYPMNAEGSVRNMIDATITGVQPLVLRLQDKTNASLHVMLTEPLKGNIYRINKLANWMSCNRKSSAAVSIASTLERDNLNNNNSKSNSNTGSVVTRRRDARRPCLQLIKAITVNDESIDQVMMLVVGGGNNNNGHLTSMMDFNSTAALYA